LDAKPLLEEYVRYITLERGLSRNTCLAYGSDLRQFFARLKGKDPLSVAQEDLADYLWELKSVKKMEGRTLSRKVEALRSFYAFQTAERRLERSPAESFRGQRLRVLLPKYLSASEIQSLLSAPVGGSFELARARTMAELLYATGMRVSELLALKLDYVNLRDGWVRVLGKGSKERLIPIHERAVSILRQYLILRARRFKDPPAELFPSRRGGPLSRVQFWRDLRALARQAGLKMRIHPHLLRHTFATHLLQGGADLRSVQELLGHSSLSTTQIYTHLERSALKSSHRRHHPRG
jgi:integrase/recombinase XerD